METDKDIEKCSEEESKEETEDQPNTLPASKSNEPHDPRVHRPSRHDEPFEQGERDAMENLLMELRGHLGKSSSYQLARLSLNPTVIYPTRFLEGEDVANNFLFNADRLVR